VTIRDINDDIHDLPGSSRFKELVFQDATVSFTDSITSSGPSNPKDIYAGWTGFERLCERADVVKIRNEDGERVLGREEWQKAQPINIKIEEANAHCPRSQWLPISPFRTPTLRQTALLILQL
jgi:hypothetical protein